MDEEEEALEHCSHLFDLEERESIFEFLVFLGWEREDIVEDGRGGSEEESSSREEVPFGRPNDEVGSLVEREVGSVDVFGGRRGGGGGSGFVDDYYDGRRGGGRHLVREEEEEEESERKERVVSRRGGLSFWEEGRIKKVEKLGRNRERERYLSFLRYYSRGLRGVRLWGGSTMEGRRQS